jgi:cell division transport system permease protein
MRALKYFFEEAVASLWRGRGSAVLAVATVSAGMFLLGLFLLIDANVGRLVSRWTEAAEMSVYLSDDASQEARARLEATLAASPEVESFTFVSKTQALARFKEDHADLAGLTDELGENPLPAAFEVRLRTTAGQEGTLAAFAERLSKTPGVADVRYDRLWVSRLLAVVTTLRGLSLALLIIVGVASALTVASVVRLTTYSRRDELEIMHLVGSPLAFIRGPFVVEGLLQGGLGAVLAVMLLRAGYTVAVMRYGQTVRDTLGLDSLAFFSSGTTLWLIVGGMVVGCVAGAVASRGLH